MEKLGLSPEFYFLFFFMLGGLSIEVKKVRGVAWPIMLL